MPAAVVEYYKTRGYGGAAPPKELGVTDDEMDRAMQFGHYVRSRLTVRTLFYVLGIPVVGPSEASSPK